jgi:hypothetical protein
MSEAKQDAVRFLRGTHLVHAIVDAMDDWCAPETHGGWSPAQKEAQMAILATRFPHFYGQDYEPNKQAIHAYWGTQPDTPLRLCVTMKRRCGKTTLIAAMIAACYQRCSVEGILIVGTNPKAFAAMTQELEEHRRLLRMHPDAFAPLRLSSQVAGETDTVGAMLGSVPVDGDILAGRTKMYWVVVQDTLPPDLDGLLQQVAPGMLDATTAYTFIRSPPGDEPVAPQGFHHLDLTNAPAPRWLQEEKDRIVAMVQQWELEAGAREAAASATAVTDVNLPE